MGSLFRARRGREPDTPAEPSDSETTGELTLGGYRVLEICAEGTYSRLFRALDPNDREVTLKVLRPGWSADALLKSRFAREIDLCATLSHPGLAACLNYGRDGDVFFVVREWVPGRPLPAWVGEKGREPSLVLDVMMPVLKGVAYLHTQGLVHRNLKASKVIVAGDGQGRLTDFCLLKRFTDASSLTPANGLGGHAGFLNPKAGECTEVQWWVGTLETMAPELLTGGQATPASDQYSLGEVLFFALTGRHSRLGLRPIALLQAKQEPPVPLREVQPALEEVLLRMMALDPSDRYEDLLTAGRVLRSA